MSIVFAAIILLAPGSARANIEFTKDSLEVVRKNLAAKKAVLVDVRSQEVWDRGHIDGSIFLPVTSLRKHSLDPEKLAKILPNKKDKTILYTFCVVGMRAKQAGIILEQQGYRVRVLKPGYEQLIESGFRKAECTRADDEDTRQRNAE
ncbi:MAG: rhodanese-like domain-containing protein [Pirellulales bacterium]|nr:rhodanese-like domain-containing protein [Pirellulales bacterium]